MLWNTFLLTKFSSTYAKFYTNARLSGKDIIVCEELGYTIINKEPKTSFTFGKLLLNASLLGFVITGISALITVLPVTGASFQRAFTDNVSEMYSQILAHDSQDLIEE